MKVLKILDYSPVIIFRKNLKRLHDIDRWEKEKENRYSSMESELKLLGFDTRGLYSNPLRGIGSALQILDEYGATVHRGTCHGDCRVSLPKASWLYDIREDCDPYILDPWLGRMLASHAIEISVWGRTIQEAAARMLINCRKAGII